MVHLPSLQRLAILVFATSSSAAPAASSNAPTATIDAGVVIGVQTSFANSSKLINQYLGVPFAASPTRFSPPQTPTPWSSPLQATQRGPACIQQFSYPEASRNFSIAAFNNPPAPESEDCLTLNIFVPAGAERNATQPKAVMFWIYGGSLQFGWNGIAAYDGSSFVVNQDVIVVVTNYRTNAFGFPGAPGLNATQRNLGFLDQRFALAWVQRNIGAFGGDKNRVTIFGESAGSFSVDALVTSYSRNTKPPFYAAIQESGEISVSASAPNNGSSWTALIAALNCTQQQNFTSDLACARAAPASLIKSIEEHAALPWGSSIDNYTYIAQGNRARAAGNIYPTPLLTGTNSDEGSIFTFGDTNTTAYLLSLGFPNSTIPLIESVYPRGSRTPGGIPITSDTTQISAIFTDLVFQCPCAIVSNTSANASIPVWRYFYNATFPAIQPIPGLNITNFGAYHSSEIPLVFGTYPLYGAASQQLMRLSEYMQASWATFARNPTGGPGWPSVASGGYVQVLGGLNGFSYGYNGSALYKPSSAFALDDGRCALWQPVYQAVSGG